MCESIRSVTSWLGFDGQSSTKPSRTSTNSGAAPANVTTKAHSSANHAENRGETVVLTITYMIQAKAVQVNHMFIQRIMDLAAIFARLDQAQLAQDAQLVRDSRGA